jgi:hypothetical protein
MTAHAETDGATEAGATFTDAEILARLRTLAAELDSDHRRLYATMERARFVAGADIAMDLLISHWKFLAYPSVGRRKHNAEVYSILSKTNAAQLMIALAWALMATRLLPRKTDADRP